MSYLDGNMNLLKKQIFLGHQIIGDKLWRDNIKLVNAGDIKGAKVIMGKLQQTVGIFNYLNYGELRPYMDAAWAQVAKGMEYADKHMPELKGILAIWKEFEPAFYSNMVKVAQDNFLSRISQIAAKYPLGGSVSNDAVTKMIYEYEQLKKAVDQIAFKL
ncbi:uncharacterized protein N7473_005930 [Penicillium subrubescens]|nr:uncharacterized protein N7473_005930 [Penicillium subrubescens]KAJ5896531.1 hypothetical protein N7473_005930 [Penicillium subrubescens]